MVFAILIVGVPEVKVPLSIEILPEAPAEALPVRRDIEPVAAAPKVLMVKALAVVSPDWMIRVPAVVFQVEAPLVAVKLREVAPVNCKAPPEVDQVEAAPAVKVRAAPVVKDEAPAEDEPMVMRLATAPLPILIFLAVVAAEPILMVSPAVPPMAIVLAVATEPMLIGPATFAPILMVP